LDLLAEGKRPVSPTTGCYIDPKESRLNQTAKCRVRRFREADVVAVRKLIHHTIDECYVRDYPPRAVQFFRDFHSEASILERNVEGELLVVEQQGRLIGTGAIVGEDIFGVFVHPEFQGKGIGSLLMRELEALAVEKGNHEAVLDVSLPSRPFYERLGYRIIAEKSIDVGEGEILRYWTANKELKPPEAQPAAAVDKPRP
jgi:ribosomal protein S18 acetylase RimI-like enzyme